MKKKELTNEEKLTLGTDIVFKILTNDSNFNNIKIEKKSEELAFLELPFYLGRLNEGDLIYKYKYYQAYNNEKKEFELKFKTLLGFSPLKLQDLGIDINNNSSQESLLKTKQKLR